MQNSHVVYETPEGIEIRLPTAGPMVRVAAWALDLLIRGVIYTITGLLLAYLGNVGQGLMLIGLFLFEWLYPTVFEVMKGATPGKMIMGLYVTMDDGTSLTWQAALIRNLLRAVDFLPFMYIAGFMCAVSNERFKRLGDIVAGTLVVYKEEYAQPNAILQPEQSITPKALAIPLTASEQRMLLFFHDRQASMSKSRRFELANLLEPVTHCRDKEASTLLAQYAVWIRGGSK